MGFRDRRDGGVVDRAVVVDCDVAHAEIGYLLDEHGGTNHRTSIVTPVRWRESEIPDRTSQLGRPACRR